MMFFKDNTSLPTNVDTIDPITLIDGAVADADADADAGETQRAEDLKALRRKIDRHIMPLVIVTFIFQSLDETSLGIAAIFDLRKDTKLIGNQFSWISGIFYLGLMLAEYPVSLLLQRFPVAKVISSIVILWGGIMMCHAASLNFANLATIRFVLGVTESVCGPGTIIVLVMWYTRAEQPFRFGIWVPSGGVAYILGGVLGYGAATVIWGCVLWVLLPDSPLTAKFLNGEERKLAILRIRENATGIENKTFKWAQFLEFIKDIKTWLFTAFGLLVNIPNGVFVNFQGIIIKSLGFTGLQTTLITMPSGAVQITTCLVATYIASTYPNTRCLVIILSLFPFLAGVIGLKVLDNSHPWGRLISVWLCFTYAAPWPVTLALANANTAGHTKRITINAFMLGIGGLGALVGPFFYKEEQEPYYTLRLNVMFFCITGQIALASSIFGLLWRENRRRRREKEGLGWDRVVAGRNGFWI